MAPKHQVFSNENHHHGVCETPKTGGYVQIAYGTVFLETQKYISDGSKTDSFHTLRQEDEFISKLDKGDPAGVNPDFLKHH